MPIMERPRDPGKNAIRMLFLPSLTGYKGLVISIPMFQDILQSVNQAEDIMQHVFIGGCKASIDAPNKLYLLWVPEGFSSVRIQLWTRTCKHEMRT